MLTSPDILNLILDIVGGRGAVNPEGLRFYNNLIDELMKAGVFIWILSHLNIFHANNLVFPPHIVHAILQVFR